jgi:hypothetical protein
MVSPGVFVIAIPRRSTAVLSKTAYAVWSGSFFTGAAARAIAIRSALTTSVTSKTEKDVVRGSEVGDGVSR